MGKRKSPVRKYICVKTSSQRSSAVIVSSDKWDVAPLVKFSSPNEGYSRVEIAHGPGIYAPTLGDMDDHAVFC